MKIVDEIIESFKKEPEKWVYTSGGMYLKRSDGLEIKTYDGPLGYKITDPATVSLDFESKYKLWQAIRLWKKEGLSLDNIMEKKRRNIN